MGRVTTNNPHGKGKKVKIEVHHKKELKDFPELALVNSNLITLCTRCHNEIHERFKYQVSKKFTNVERW
jgi:predicted HNH restriction endonuclease|nr:MAG TPA: HNH endonuclease bacteriophage, HNH Endonuclease, DNA.52A [Caudoviricetes sp.]